MIAVTPRLAKENTCHPAETMIPIGESGDAEDSASRLPSCSTPSKIAVPPSTMVLASWRKGKMSLGTDNQEEDSIEQKYSIVERVRKLLVNLSVRCTNSLQSNVARVNA